MIVLFTSTEPELEHHRRRLATALRTRPDGPVTVRQVPLTTTPEHRAGALRGVDAVVCLLGDHLAPELPDGSGYAEVEVAAARRLGVHVLAYSHGTPGGDDDTTDPLQRYSMARARRFHTWLREHYGVRRFATAEDLVAGVVEDLAGLQADPTTAEPPTIRQLHRRLQARRTTAYDAYAISLHNMDVIFRVREVAPFREEMVDPPRCLPGGAGANIAYCLARLGGRTAVTGAIAEDTDGAALRANLEQAGVGTDLLLRLPADSPERTGRSHIFADARGRMSIFTEAGANARFAAELDRSASRSALLDDLRRARAVVLTSFNTAAERRLQDALVTELAPDTLVAYTPGSLYRSPGARWLAPTLTRTNVLFVSEQALPRLLNDVVPHINDQTASTPQQVHQLIQWRYDLGADSPLMIVVRRSWRGYEKRDALGHIYIGWGHQGLEDSAATEGRLAADDTDRLIDGTGTGGALAAGVLHGLLRARPPEDCADLAYVMAMAIATRYGSRDGMPSRDTIAAQWRQWLRTDTAPSWI